MEYLFIGVMIRSIVIVVNDIIDNLEVIWIGVNKYVVLFGFGDDIVFRIIDIFLVVLV